MVHRAQLLLLARLAVPGERAEVVVELARAGLERETLGIPLPRNLPPALFLWFQLHHARGYDTHTRHELRVLLVSHAPLASPFIGSEM